MVTKLAVAVCLLAGCVAGVPEDGVYRCTNWKPGTPVLHFDSRDPATVDTSYPHHVIFRDMLTRRMVAVSAWDGWACERER